MRSTIAAFVLALGAPCLAGAAGAPSSEAGKFDRAAAARAVEELATALERDFVDPETGVAYARMLRQAHRGRGLERRRDARGVRRGDDARPPRDPV
jgi:hypothetical protein